MYTFEEVAEYILTFNLITAMFYFYSVIITVFGIFIHLKYFGIFNIPQIFCDCYNYGKLLQRKKVHFVHSFFQIPKRWFIHFYFTSSVMSVVCCTLFWFINQQGNIFPEAVEKVFSFLTTRKRYPAVSSHLAWVSLLLYSGHTFKRLYECLHLSIFSDSLMNVPHYIVGHTHYVGAFVGLVSLFPGIALMKDDLTITDSRTLSWLKICAIVFVLVASLSQFHSLQILATLRKDSIDENRKNKYLIPVGGLFTFVSCPHMLSEILVYFGLAALMGFSHATWNVVCLFVFCNQTQVALLNHRWYKEHFRDYPLERKAIFPYIL